MKPSLLLVGLGNPGDSYLRTRHNMGFRAMDRLSIAFGEGAWKPADKFQAVIQEGRVVTVPVLLVKPQTFMNDSGTCIRKIIDFYKMDPAAQLLVFNDDIDIPLGELRLRMNGGPGTHNGLKSIVTVFGEAFPRLRIGIGTPQKSADLATWVLSVPSVEEERVLEGALATLPELVRTFVMEDLTKKSHP